MQTPNFTVTLVAFLIILITSIEGIAQRFFSYKKTTRYSSYTDNAILKKAIEEEAELQYKIAIIFLFISVVVDIIIFAIKN